MLFRAASLYVPMTMTVVWIAPPAKVFPATFENFALSMVAAFILATLVIQGSAWLTLHVEGVKQTVFELSQMVGRLTDKECWHLAILSGFGEEILFRGVLQPRLGWVETSILFGLIHCYPLNRRMVYMVGFATLAGLMLGWLVQTFELIWPAIVMHILINGINLNRISRL